MNKEQREHLTSRVRLLVRTAKYAEEPPLPAKVRQAKRLLENYEQKRRKRLRARQDKLEKEARLVSQVILFGEPEAALKAVQEFERKHGQ